MEYETKAARIRTSRSGIWKYFEEDPKTKLATCSICYKKYSYITSLSNLSKHLSRIHGKTYKKSERISTSSAYLSSLRTGNEYGNEYSLINENSPGVAVNSEMHTDCIVSPVNVKSEFSYVLGGEDNLTFENHDIQGTDHWVKIERDHMEEPGSTEVDLYNQEVQSNASINPLEDIENPLSEKIKALSGPCDINKNKDCEHISTSAIQSADSCPKDESIDRAFLYLIIQDFQPFSIVEEKGFVRFVNTLNPSYQLPKVSLIAEDMVPKLYDKCRKSVKSLLIDEAKSICITADTWTALDGSYCISLTAHFMTDNLQFKSVMLDCILFSKNPTIKTLAEEIKRILHDWNITNQVIIAISDGSSPIANALKSQGFFPHLTCFANTLNIVMTEALNLLELPTQKFKAILFYFHNNLSQSQKDSERNEYENIPQESCIEWLSSFHLFRSLLAIRERIADVQNTENLPEISDEEWEACSQLCDIMKHFEEITRILTTEKYLSGSMVIVLSRALFTVCSKLSKTQFAGNINLIIETLNEQLYIRLNNVDIEHNKNLALATFLDPRFKLHFFSNKLATGHIKETVRQMILSRTEKEELVTEDAEYPSALSIWGQVDCILENANPNESGLALKADKEIDTYLKFNLLSRQSSPEDWWKEHGRYLPNLLKIYQEQCGVVATCVPCDRIFTSSGRVLMNRRSLLSAKCVQQLVFLNANLDYV